MSDGGVLGDRLRRKRRQSSLTQEELAHISGVSQEMVAKIEQGRRHPRLTVLTKRRRLRGWPPVLGRRIREARRQLAAADR